MEETEIQPEEIIEEQPKTGFFEKLNPPTGGHKFKILGGILGILIIAGAVFGAYKLGQRQLQPSQSSPTPEAVVTPTPDPTADWKTYTNTEYGYSIKYPKDWYITEPEGGPEKGRRMDFHPWRERSFDKVDYQISIIVNDVGYEKSLTAWLDEKIGSYPEEIKSLITREKVTLDNFEGEKVLEELSQAGVYNIYTKKNSFVYNFMLAPYSPKELSQLLPESLDYFNLILSTFKFLPSTNSGQGEEWKTYSNTNVPFTFKYPLELSYFVQNTAEATGLKNIIIQIQNWDPDKPFPSDFNTNGSYFNFLISGHIGEDFQAMLNDSDLGLDETEREMGEVGEIEAFEGMGKRHGEEGVKTVMFQYKDWVFTAQVWPKHSNKLGWFDQILSTFKFLD